VWVGFDDNTELDLEGAHSAAPIWADFMKRATAFREYRDTRSFEAPGGIVSVTIDPESGMPATPACPTQRSEVYIAGSEPVGTCPLHGGRNVTNVAGWDTSSPKPANASDPAENLPRVTGSGGDGAVRRPQVQPGPATPAAQQQPQPPPKKPEEKKGIFRRIWGVFK
jgi:penicillin-binding protein 1B